MTDLIINTNNEYYNHYNYTMNNWLKTSTSELKIFIKNYLFYQKNISMLSSGILKYFMSLLIFLLVNKTLATILKISKKLIQSADHYIIELAVISFDYVCENAIFKIKHRTYINFIISYIHMCYMLHKWKSRKQVLPRFEFGSQDSKSWVLTITP